MPIILDELLANKVEVNHGRALSTTYHAMSDDMFITPEGLHKDIVWFFGFPITKLVWEGLKQFQDKGFVVFVEGCRNGKLGG